MGKKWLSTCLSAFTVKRTYYIYLGGSATHTAMISYTSVCNPHYVSSVEKNLRWTLNLSPSVWTLMIQYYNINCWFLIYQQLQKTNQVANSLAKVGISIINIDCSIYEYLRYCSWFSNAALIGWY